MDFGFTQEQEMLRDGVSKYLEKSYDFDTRQKVVRGAEPWSGEAWQQFAEFGLLALPFAESQGGLGGTISDCMAVAELLGEHLSVEPFATTIMLAGAALAASDSARAGRWLERIIAGEASAAFAYEEGSGTANPDMIRLTATASADGFSLTGEKRLVIAGGEADIVVVAARLGDNGPLALLLVEGNAEGIERRTYTTIDGRSAANIAFNAVAIADDCVLHRDAGDTLTRIINHAIITQCAEAVGAMGALLDITGEYAGTRKQFGVPIGTFQAVAHRLADMKIAYNKARATLVYTTALAQSGAATQRDIAILKGQTGKLGRAIGEAAIQTHGGVGMTDELSVSHYHKRLLAIDAQFGAHDYHLRMLGQP